jgi:hypothetical protein
LALPSIFVGLVAFISFVDSDAFRLFSEFLYLTLVFPRSILQGGSNAPLLVRIDAVLAHQSPSKSQNVLVWFSGTFSIFPATRLRRLVRDEANKLK